MAYFSINMMNLEIIKHSEYSLEMYVCIHLSKLSFSSVCPFNLEFRPIGLTYVIHILPWTEEVGPNGLCLAKIENLNQKELTVQRNYCFYI